MGFKVVKYTEGKDGKTREVLTTFAKKQEADEFATAQKAKDPLRPMTEALGGTEVRYEVEGDNPPTSFLSYTWESPEHQSWVLDLATKLQQNGVKVVFDKWDMKYGDDLGHFMETSVRESGSVIIVCTPTYAKKANAGIGGAGYEKQIVTGEMFHGAPASKFIPLIRKGSDAEALPSFLKSKNYIDFRNGTEFEKKLEDLLHQLHDVPKHPRPPLGQSPFNKPRRFEPPGVIPPTSVPGLPPPLDMALTQPRTQPQTKQNGAYFTYCRLCGVFPGPQTECVGSLANSHSFTAGIGVIYCSRCGQTPGKPTECTRVLSLGHNFVSGDGTEFCQRCGARLGQQLVECIGRVCHDFGREFDPKRLAIN